MITTSHHQILQHHCSLQYYQKPLASIINLAFILCLILSSFFDRCISNFDKFLLDRLLLKLLRKSLSIFFYIFVAFIFSYSLQKIFDESNFIFSIYFHHQCVYIICQKLSKILWQTLLLSWIFLLSIRIRQFLFIKFTNFLILIIISMILHRS